MKKATSMKKGGFGKGIVEPITPPRAKHYTPRAIEKRLYDLLLPLILAQGGILSTLEDVGEEGMHGLSVTFANDQSFDLRISEVSQ
jgi:hypothetical protein